MEALELFCANLKRKRKKSLSLIQSLSRVAQVYSHPKKKRLRLQKNLRLMAVPAVFTDLLSKRKRLLLFQRKRRL